MNAVFVLASPKEGTQYITRILMPLAGSYGQREPDAYIGWEPDIVRLRSHPLVLDRFNSGHKKEVEKLWETKFKHIDKHYRHHRLYFESDFRFLMLWADYAARDILNIKVVVMHRPMALIVKSLVWFGFYTPTEIPGGKGHGFLLQPQQASNLTVMAPGKVDATQKAIWHTFEINERKKRFLRRYRRIKAFHFNLVEDRDERTFLKLFNFLGVPKNEMCLDLVRCDPVVNSWMRNPKFKDSISIEEIQDRIDNYTVIYKSERRTYG